MAWVVSTETNFTDEQRRQRLYNGEVFLIPPRASIRALTDFAMDMITDAFGKRDPLTAHNEMPVDQYVEILKPLKPGFTHHPRAKELVREILVDLGADPELTYFDVPKLRVVPTAAYLSSGLGYNYTPHRDTWYSAPQCQNNWWAPIAGSNALTGMQFHPDYWLRPIDNTSAGFDNYEWNRTSRRDAANYITEDPRPHPKLAEGGPGHEIRLVGEPGSIMNFSGAQLHSTVPNETEKARLSIDFRTVHIDDLRNNNGPANVDSHATGTSVRDYIRADNYEPLPDEVVALFDKDGSKDGVLVFDPSVLKA